jgi:hypothetical protein
MIAENMVDDLVRTPLQCSSLLMCSLRSLARSRLVSFVATALKMFRRRDSQVRAVRKIPAEFKEAFSAAVGALRRCVLSVLSFV